MPLVRVSLKTGKSDAYRQQICDGLYRAMREALDVPDGDQFITITEHNDSNFRYGTAFGVERSDDLLYVQITLFETRPLDQRRALFRRICSIFVETLGVRSEDVFINLLDSPKHNWSVGRGEPLPA